MNYDYIVRLETEKDYREVEELTREAFWNIYKPGADEHYFVHMMRSHPDFVPELAFVIEKDGKIIGSIMYTKAWLEDENGERKEILSFGPLCVAPEYQRQKLGKLLIEHSFEAGALDGRKWMYIPSTAADCCEDTAGVEAFDATFPPKEKAWMPSQEEFYIYSHSSVVR